MDKTKIVGILTALAGLGLILAGGSQEAGMGLIAGGVVAFTGRDALRKVIDIGNTLVVYGGKIIDLLGKLIAKLEEKEKE